MFLQLMQRSAGHGIEWFVIFLEDGPLVQSVRELGICTRSLSAGRLRQAHRFAATVVRVATLLREFQADGVLSWMPKAHLYGSLAALLARLPAFWFQMGVPTRRDFFDRLVSLLPTDGIFVLSKLGFAGQSALSPRVSIRLVHPGVDLERFDPHHMLSPVDLRVRHRIDPDGPIIGLVGRLQRWKGVHTLIEAMPRIREEYPNVKCLIVGAEHSGEREYPQVLERTIQRLELAECVQMAGLQKDIPEWMQMMDVVVHASDREPFGIVILEAMALGKPVVAGNQGGPLEIVEPGLDGLLAEFENPAQLAEAILRYLQDPSLAQRVGLAAQEKARMFSVEQYVAHLVEGLKEFAMRSGGRERSALS